MNHLQGLADLQRNLKKGKQKSLVQEIVSNWSKRVPTRTRHAFEKYLVRGNRFNYVSCDFGKYNIPDFDILVETLLILRSRKNFNSSLVPQIGINTIFHADIDYLDHNETIGDLITHTNTVLGQKYDEELLQNYYITKSETYHKFHVYYPDIILEKDALDLLWHDINAECKSNGMKGRIDEKTGERRLPVDTNCNRGLRLDGFNKWNKDLQMYDEKTLYLPYSRNVNGTSSDFMLDKEFYHSTNLLIGDNVDCSRRKGMKKQMTINDPAESEFKDDSYDSLGFASTMGNSSNNSVLNRNTSSTSNSLNDSSSQLFFSSQNNNLSSDSLNSSSTNFSTTLESSFQYDSVQEDIGNISMYGQEALKHLSQKFPFLLSYLFGHNITKIDLVDIGKTNEKMYIQCGKNEKDRYCPFKQRVHRNNNIYYIWSKKEQHLELKCRDKHCQKSSKVIYRHGTVPRYLSQSFQMDNGDDQRLDTGDAGEYDVYTDIDLAKLFLDYYPDLMYSTQFRFKKKDDGTFFHFDRSTGLWIADKGTHKLKRQLSVEFKNKIKNTWTEKIFAASDEGTQKALRGQRLTLIKKLGDFKNIRNVLSALKTMCIEEHELDENPWYFVANDKVWDLENNELVIPRKEEFITNTIKAPFDIVDFDQEMNDYIHNNLFKKLFPDEDERKTVLIYLSTILNGKTLKKFCINLGPGGENGKSKLCEILKDLLGDYAHKASAKLLLGKDDAASFANFAHKRFIYFEEPEFKRKIQSYLIKELTGGNEFSARNLYSSNTSNKLCATFVLNTNNIPQFTQADNAMANRLITITWNSRFTKKKDEVNEDEHIYQADNNIGNKAWNQKYLPHLFNYLLKFHDEWIKNGEIIPETEKQQKDNSEILNFSDNFKNWLDTEVVNTNRIRDFVTFEQLTSKLKGSEYWLNLPKNVKGLGAYQFLKKELRDRNDTRKFIRQQKKIRGTRKYIWNLCSHQLRSEYREQDDDKLSGRKRLRSKSGTQEFDEFCSSISDRINSSIEPPRKKQRKN